MIIGFKGLSPSRAKTYGNIAERVDDLVVVEILGEPLGVGRVGDELAGGVEAWPVGEMVAVKETVRWNRRTTFAPPARKGKDPWLPS